MCAPLRQRAGAATESSTEHFNRPFTRVPHEINVSVGTEHVGAVRDLVKLGHARTDLVVRDGKLALCLRGPDGSRFARPSALAVFA